MLIANEEDLSQAFLQICLGNCIVGIESHVKRVFRWTRVYGYWDAHSLRRSRYMFVTTFKLTAFIILNISCEKNA